MLRSRICALVVESVCAVSVSSRVILQTSYLQVWENCLSARRASREKTAFAIVFILSDALGETAADPGDGTLAPC